jgi:hypothetical protein
MVHSCADPASSASGADSLRDGIACVQTFSSNSSVKVAQNTIAHLQFAVQELGVGSSSRKEAVQSLGLFYEKLQQPYKAESLYTKHLELQENDSEILTRLGCLYLRLGKRAVAFTTLEKAMKLDPKNDHAAAFLGLLLKLQDQHQRAVPLLRRGLQLKDPMDKHLMYLNLGDALQRLGQLIEVRVLNKKAVEQGVFADEYQRPVYMYKGLRSFPLWYLDESIDEDEAGDADAEVDASKPLRRIQRKGRAHDAHLEVVRMLEEPDNFEVIQREALAVIQDERKRANFVNNPQRLVVGAGDATEVVRLALHKVKLAVKELLGWSKVERGGAEITHNAALPDDPAFSSAATSAASAATSSSSSAFSSSELGSALHATLPSWSQLYFFEHGYKDHKNCRACPRTCALLEAVPALINCTHCDAKLSLALPGLAVRPHCGPSNARIRIHLGIGGLRGASIKVGRESEEEADTKPTDGGNISWAEGRAFAFDDSFEHDLVHHGTTPRLVLIVDVWHPDLTMNGSNPLIAPPITTGGDPVVLTSTIPLVSPPTSVIQNNPAEYNKGGHTGGDAELVLPLLGLLLFVGVFLYCYFKYFLFPLVLKGRKWRWSANEGSEDENEDKDEDGDGDEDEARKRTGGTSRNSARSREPAGLRRRKAGGQ